MRAAVHAPVSILEVLRSAPRMNDQKPYPRLNGIRGRAARHRKGTGEQFTFSPPKELFIVRSGARVEVADH